MSRNFTKLFSSITESTVWCEPNPTRIVWICMLAMADRHGRVWASIPGLANRARVDVEEARQAIERFLSPDKDSRTPDFEGRRIVPIDGGWKLLNHAKYRAIQDEEAKREADAERQRKHRARVTQPCDSHNESQRVAQAEADTGTSKEKKARKRAVSQTSISADFGISERVKRWAEEHGHTNLEKRLEMFVGWAKSKGAKYADWDEAFMRAVREDWAKLSNGTSATDTAWLAFRACISSGKSPLNGSVGVLGPIISKFGGLQKLGGMSSYDIDRMRDEFDRTFTELSQ